MSDSVESGNAALLRPCGHSEPQSDSQLHGVCIFCWRDRGTALVRENARLRERVENLGAMLRQCRDEKLRGRVMEPTHKKCRECKSEEVTAPSCEVCTSSLCVSWVCWRYHWKMHRKGKR